MRAPLLTWEEGELSIYRMRRGRAAPPMTHKERLRGIEWQRKWKAAHRDEEAGDAVQLDPLVPAVAAPLEGDGNDFAD